MSDLWTDSEAVQATGGKSGGHWRAGGVSIDSRSLNAGDLFIALAGENGDGHDWVGAAMDKGAAAAMVSRPVQGVDPAKLLHVTDTMTGLQALGRAARDRMTARVIGVTGSAGKTGCKNAIRHVLAAAGAVVHASERSYNNHWGVPLTLARTPRNADYAVLEMGMNRPGEIAALTAMVRPHVALITTIAPAHMAAFDSMDAIADAKAEIFGGMSVDGIAVIPADLPQSARLIAAARTAGIRHVKTFGADDLATARLISARVKPDRSCVRAMICDTEATYCVRLAGEHWVLNSLGVLATAGAAGGDLGLAAPALAQLQPMAGRGARIQIHLPDGAFTLIDDSYNANPASMRAALSVLGAANPPAPGRRIAIMGDMLELGAGSPDMHAGLSDAVVECGADPVFLCGSEMKVLADRLDGQTDVRHAPTSVDLAQQCLQEMRPGDVVLVKGSLGISMSVIVEALKSLETIDIRRRAVSG